MRFLNVKALVCRYFQTGEGPSRGLLRDCETYAKVIFELYSIAIECCALHERMKD